MATLRRSAMRRVGRLWLAATLCSAAPAAGDGFMAPRLRPVGQSKPMVVSPRQEAVLATDGQTVQVVLRTHFRAGPKELAWVVPVPAKPLRVEKCQAGIFSDLDRATAPRFYWLDSASGIGHFDCGCAAMAPSGRAPIAGAVTVEASGTAGIFQYVVLSARRADELTRWLNDNKYFVPIGSERIFKRYVEAGWHWLAMRVRPEQADKGTLAPHPIVYTYRDTRLVYPLVISRLSADLTNEIVLYVVARQRYACANWSNATIDRAKVRRDAATPSGTNYERLFEDLCRSRRWRVFVTEASMLVRVFGEVANRGLLDGVKDPDLARALGSQQTLTRLRAVMTPQAMDRDVDLLPAPSWGRVSNTFEVSAAAAPRPALATAWPLAAFAVLSAGVGLTGRSGWARRAGGVCVILSCAAFVLM